MKKKLKRFLGMDEEQQNPYLPQQTKDTQVPTDEPVSQPSNYTDPTSVEQNDIYNNDSINNEEEYDEMNVNTQLVIRSPKDFEQAQETANCVISKNPVFLDLKAVDAEMATRILDFLSGVIYTLEGDIRQMAPRMYLLTPPNVNVDGLEGLIPEN